MKDFLVKARERVAQGWTQASFGRDADGVSCGSGSDRARSWCLVGALLRASHEGDPRLYEPAHHLLVRLLEADPVWWNDAPGRTQADVLALLDRAIDVA